MYCMFMVYGAYKKFMWHSHWKLTAARFKLMLTLVGSSCFALLALRLQKHLIRNSEGGSRLNPKAESEGEGNEAGYCDCNLADPNLNRFFFSSLCTACSSSAFYEGSSSKTKANLIVDKSSQLPFTSLRFSWRPGLIDMSISLVIPWQRV